MVRISSLYVGTYGYTECIGWEQGEREGSLGPFHTCVHIYRADFAAWVYGCVYVYQLNGTYSPCSAAEIYQVCLVWVSPAVHAYSRRKRHRYCCWCCTLITYCYIHALNKQQSGKWGGGEQRCATYKKRGNTKVHVACTSHQKRGKNHNDKNGSKFKKVSD